MLPTLAEFAPISADFQLNVWNILIFLSTLAALWTAVRRKPPLDAHLAKFEASISTLTESVNKLTEAQEQAAGHATEIRALKERVAILEQQRDTDAKAQREYMRTSTRELFERIESVEKAVATNFQAVERALGRLEGQIAAGKP